MDKKKLQIEQLESRIKLFSPTLQLPNPPTGWVKAIRSALGMTMQQLANKLGITKQSVQEIELREKEGSITLKSLKETARALDMELVYGFVPKEGTLDKYLESKARFLAEQIVYRTSISMKLEDQQNSNERIKKAIDERTILIKQELPKALWD
jgi:predicted DNA-binding mobile mystery protein A